MEPFEFLLLLTPGLPVLFALAWLSRRLRPALFRWVPLAVLPGLALGFLPGAEGAAVVLPGVFTGVHLGVDPLARALLLLTCLLWGAAGLFAQSYHSEDPRRDAFFGFFVLTMTGNLGLLVSADILAFYLFFAMMTFAAYGLVVHRRDRVALRAGRVYIVMAIVGELGLLSGLFILGVAAGGAPLFGLELEAAWRILAEGAGELEGSAEITGGAAWLAAFLLLAGFGVKAGLVPLHLWLPLAHPVAPTAASALLSGVMIKAGLLGWLRYLPTESAVPLLGGALIMIGVGAAFYGVLVGLAQDDPKTVLAYSSVSQMGYMALGTGILLIDPGLTEIALLGVVFYALHHGVAKGALFLAVGVAERTPAASTWRLPLLLGTALPALALTGAPFTSGARAKLALKEAMQALGGPWYTIVDPLLLIAAVGTTLLMARFLSTMTSRVGAHADHGEKKGGAVGLAFPWIGLLALGGAGAWLLPLAYGLPEGVSLPGLLEGLGASAWPVLLGGGLAWVAWQRPELLGTVAGTRIPAGDLIVPIEALIVRTRGLPQEALLARGVAAVGQVRSVQRRSHAWAVWVAERDLYLMRGTILGALLMVLTVVLGVLLG